jgi:two-component system LytT family response regulator
MSKIRVLIVDDEPPARARLRLLLEKESDVEVVGECSDGIQAIGRIQTDAPDLVFLDIQMPGANGFSVVQHIGADAMPMVIFATAYEGYALRAFEAHALDYLLKPYEDERFHAALDRAREQLQRAAPETDVRLSTLEAFLGGAERRAFPDVFAIRAGDHYQIVRVADIRWIQAEGSYVRLHLVKGDRLMRHSIRNMEQNLLDPQHFLRIHRSTIVNLASVVAIEPTARAEYNVVLDDGTRVTCSRGYRDHLRERVFFSG